jgi:GTP-binding protein
MKIKTVSFVKSSAEISQCPESDLAEYAFVGRSNVGKSSLINHLTDRKKLALTSGNPGKTRLINHFIVNDEWCLVDLPGYGYAKVSKTDRVKFNRLIKAYLTKRENLACLFLLIDIRHDPVLSDIEFIEWLAIKMVPFVIVFTKADKIPKAKITESVEKYKERLMEQWEELPNIYITSSHSSIGREDILSFIEDTNSMLKSN